MSDVSAYMSAYNVHSWYMVREKEEIICPDLSWTLLEIKVSLLENKSESSGKAANILSHGAISPDPFPFMN